MLHVTVLFALPFPWLLKISISKTVGDTVLLQIPIPAKNKYPSCIIHRAAFNSPLRPVQSHNRGDNSRRLRLTTMKKARKSGDNRQLPPQYYKDLSVYNLA